MLHKREVWDGVMTTGLVLVLVALFLLAWVVL